MEENITLVDIKEEEISIEDTRVQEQYIKKELDEIDPFVEKEIELPVNERISIVQQCYHCFSQIDSIDFNGHVIECRKKLQSRTCEHCGTIFTNKHFKNQHIVKEHPVAVTCTKCPKLVLKSKLNSHLNTHKLKTCDICSKKMTCMELKRHFLLCKKKLLLRTCEQCGKMFPNPISKEKHMKEHCAWVSCSKCPQIVLSKNLNSHLNVHNLQRCGICSKKMSLKKLQPHVVMCSKRMQLRTCEQCGELFENSVYKHKHMEEKHFATAIRCDICSKKMSLQKLQNHVMGCSRRMRLRTCEQCGELFANSVYKQKHIKEKHCASVLSKYCPSCDKHFQTNKEINQHLPDCLKLRTCDQCKEIFKTVVLKVFHMRMEHRSTC